MIVEVPYFKRLEKTLYNKHIPLKLLSEPLRVHHLIDFQCQICGHEFTSKSTIATLKGCPKCNLPERHRFVAHSLIRSNKPFQMWVDLGELEGDRVIADFYIEETKTCIAFIGGPKFEEKLRQLEGVDKSRFVYKQTEYFKELPDFCSQNGFKLLVLNYSMSLNTIRFNLLKNYLILPE